MARQTVAEIAAQYASIISTKDVMGRGVSCQFYFIGPNIGLKMYSNKRVRDNNFFVQNLLWSKGLAPRGHKRLNIGRGQYAFTTELCEVAQGFSEQKRKIQVFGSPNHFRVDTYWNNWYAAGAKLVKDAENVLADVLEVRDTHEGNWGINYQTSELNIIDVGHFRVSGTYNSKARPWEGKEYRVENCPTKLLCELVKSGLGVDMRKL